MNADTPVHRVTRLTVFTKSKLGQTCLNSFSELHPRIITRPEENKTKSTRKRGRPLTHGLSNRPIYRSFWEAKRRCTDSRHKDYQNYGGRGIEFRFISASDLLAAI